MLAKQIIPTQEFFFLYTKKKKKKISAKIGFVIQCTWDNKKPILAQDQC